MSDLPVAEIEQAPVTKETKFRRGGFKPSAELIAETEAQAAAGEVPQTEQPEDAVMAAAIAADVTAGEGVSFEEPQAPPEEPPQEETPQAEPKFKLGGREFGSQEEAWAYAEQLEQERLAADAFRQGVELASKANQGNPVPQPVPSAPEEIDPEYYTNPQGYFAKRESEIIAKAKAAVDQDLRLRKSHEDTWGQFYTDYPDLAAAREFVDLTLQQNWATLQHVEKNQALKQLAEKTRAKLKPIIDARLPKTQLPKVTTAASPGGAQQVTPQKKQPQALSLTQQMKNLKKNRAQFR